MHIIAIINDRPEPDDTHRNSGFGSEVKVLLYPLLDFPIGGGRAHEPKLSRLDPAFRTAACCPRLDAWVDDRKGEEPMRASGFEVAGLGLWSHARRPVQHYRALALPALLLCCVAIPASPQTPTSEAVSATMPG